MGVIINAIWFNLIKRGEAIKESFEKNKNKLTDHEIMAIELRFGFRNGKPSTLDEIGRIMCVSKQRVWQIISKAVKKLGFVDGLRKLG